jgi:hypothetical protein
VLGSSGLNRVGPRRILACPRCQRLQYIIPRPALFDIVCKHCDRGFRVAETGAVATVAVTRAADREDEPAILARRRPGQVFIDRRSGSADEIGEPSPRRSLGDRLREMSRRLRSTAIALLALAVAAAAVYTLLVVLASTHTAVRRSLPEGSMKRAFNGR